MRSGPTPRSGSAPQSSGPGQARRDRVPGANRRGGADQRRLLQQRCDLPRPLPAHRRPGPGDVQDLGLYGGERRRSDQRPPVILGHERERLGGHRARRARSTGFLWHRQCALDAAVHRRSQLQRRRRGARLSGGEPALRPSIDRGGAPSSQGQRLPQFTPVGGQPVRTIFPCGTDHRPSERRADRPLPRSEEHLGIEHSAGIHARQRDPDLRLGRRGAAPRPRADGAHRLDRAPRRDSRTSPGASLRRPRWGARAPPAHAQDHAELFEFLLPQFGEELLRAGPLPLEPRERTRLAGGGELVLAEKDVPLEAAKRPLEEIAIEGPSGKTGDVLEVDVGPKEPGPSRRSTFGQRRRTLRAPSGSSTSRSAMLKARSSVAPRSSRSPCGEGRPALVPVPIPTAAPTGVPPDARRGAGFR